MNVVEESETVDFMIGNLIWMELIQTRAVLSGMCQVSDHMVKLFGN